MDNNYYVFRHTTYTNFKNGQIKNPYDRSVFGIKIYSTDTCILVPQRINMLFMNQLNKRGLPNGIYQKSTGYSVEYAGKKCGIRKTLEDAYKLYSENKKESIINIANDYKDIIPFKLYKALLAYEVRIDVDRNYVA